MRLEAPPWCIPPNVAVEAWLRENGFLSICEAAEILGITRHALQVRIRRGRRRQCGQVLRGRPFVDVNALRRQANNFERLYRGSARSAYLLLKPTHDARVEGVVRADDAQFVPLGVRRQRRICA